MKTLKVQQNLKPQPKTSAFNLITNCHFRRPLQLLLPFLLYFLLVWHCNVPYITVNITYNPGLVWIIQSEELSFYSVIYYLRNLSHVFHIA